MTDLAAMTLGEMEALAERLEGAAKTIRGAMALMGGPVVIQNGPAPVGLVSPGIVTHVAAPHPGLDAGEIAERTRLLAQMRNQQAMNTPSSNVDAGALND